MKTGVPRKARQGRLEAAADAFQKVLEMDPTHGPTNRHMTEVRKLLRERVQKKKPGGRA